MCTGLGSLGASRSTIKGFSGKGDWEERISLYTYDILLYATQPHLIVDRILHVFQLFGDYSGYQINLDKSLIFPFAGGTPILLSRCIAPVVHDSFQYPGIYVTWDAGEFSEKFVPSIGSLKSDVAHWQSLPVSMMGRAVLFKMLSLPAYSLFSRTPHTKYLLISSRKLTANYNNLCGMEVVLELRSVSS